MHIISLRKAKKNLSKFVDYAFKGDEIIICKAGKPMARLVKYEMRSRPRVPGCWEGKVHIAEDFDTLPKTLMDAF